MWSKTKYISPIVVVALVVGWVLLLLPCVTPPANGGLYLARIRGLDRNYDVRFGIFDSGGNTSPSWSLENTGGSSGYRTSLRFPLEFRYPDGSEVDRPGRPPRYVPYTAVRGEDTDALVLFPVTLALLGLALLCYIPGDVKQSGGWLGFSALFAFVSSALGWTAWGYAYTLTSKIESNIGRYINSPNAIWELAVEMGNVIWPSLVGMILVTLAAVLILIKVVTRPRKLDEPEQRELGPISRKNSERNNPLSSNETLTNP